MATNRILLIQPRHIYAPPDTNIMGHVYMPTSLLTISALFLHLGLEVDLVDENIEKAIFNNDIIGFNLLGAPYVPVILNYINRIKAELENDYQLLLGGQTISGFNDIELRTLFTNNVLNGNSIQNLARLLNIQEPLFPKIENLSLISSYSLLKKDNLRLYLGKEFSFYLSQGCKYSCSFCSADRNLNIDSLGIRKKRKEIYRNIEVAVADFEYLMMQALDFKIPKLDVYLSNLDLFQTPDLLKQFAQGICELRKKIPQVNIEMRGLSTTRSFLNTHNKFHTVIESMVGAGLNRIGFGIDGATANVYKETRKPQTVQESLDSIRIAKEIYDITPEVLMVFGHNNKEDEASLKSAYDFCIHMQEKFGALPRPHVAKDVVPGNDGWYTNTSIRNMLIQNPMLFQNLDFTAIPSPISHPDPKFRRIVEKYYKKICNLKSSLTQYVLAELPTMSDIQLEQVKLFNQGKYDI